MMEDWMTPEHKAAALEGFMGNPVAVAYARATAEQPTGLADWLIMQIAEDERIAIANDFNLWPGDTLRKVAENKTHYAWQPHDVSPQRIAHILRFDPKRVLAECDTKRRIIELCKPPLVDVSPPTRPGTEFIPGMGRPWGEPVLRLLALPYADRPGYRAEWRP